MTLLSLELFKQDLQQPALLLQQLEQLSQQVTLGAAKLPSQRRQQLRKQVQEVVHDAQQLCRLVSEQHSITGKDPLCRATAAGISLGLMGFDSDGSDDESDEVAGAVDGLDAEAEQQLRRVFSVTDSLSRQQVCWGGVVPHREKPCMQVHADHAWCSISHSSPCNMVIRCTPLRAAGLVVTESIMSGWTQPLRSNLSKRPEQLLLI